VRVFARSSVFTVAVAALAAAVIGPAGAIQPPSPGQPNVSLPQGRIFYTNNEGNAGFPSLFNASVTNSDGSRISRLFTTYGVGKDSAGQNATAMLTSTDDGKTWSPVELPSNWIGVTNAVRLSNLTGTVVLIDYEPITLSQSAPDPNPATPHNENDTVFGRWVLSGTTPRPAGTATTSYPGSPQSRVRTGSSLTSTTPSHRRWTGRVPGRPR
jgi:hypothetical protein